MDFFKRLYTWEILEQVPLKCRQPCFPCGNKETQLCLDGNALFAYSVTLLKSCHSCRHHVTIYLCLGPTFHRVEFSFVDLSMTILCNVPLIYFMVVPATCTEGQGCIFSLARVSTIPSPTPHPALFCCPPSTKAKSRPKTGEQAVCLEVTWWSKNQGHWTGREGKKKYGDTLLSCSFPWVKCSVLMGCSFKCVSELLAWRAEAKESIYPLASASFWLRLAL